jgi:hypothetical protein
MTKASCDGSALDCNKAIKEILRLENRWFDLKNWVADTGISPKDSPSKDYQVGHNEALEGILHYMKNLEEK